MPFAVLFLSIVLSPYLKAAEATHGSELPASSELSFSLEQLSVANIASFQSYIAKERANLKQLIDDFNMDESTEGSGYLRDLEDPLVLASDMLNDLSEGKREWPEYGLFLSSLRDERIKDDDQQSFRIINVFVMPTRERTIQIHQFIFRSLRYKQACAASGMEDHKKLSIILHETSRRTLGSRYVCARPIPFMARLLRGNGFRELSNEHARLRFGVEYDYERQHGVAYDGFRLVIGALETLVLPAFESRN